MHLCLLFNIYIFASTEGNIINCLIFFPFSCPPKYSGSRCEIFIPTLPPVDTISPTSKQRVCEPLTIPLCQGLEYNHTMFPNMLNHKSQQQAALEVHQFFPLIQVGCSKDLAFFLCSVYAPICTVINTPVPPCRSLCNSAKLGCEGLMKRFGFGWPESLKCDRFPELGEEICLTENLNSTSLQPPASKTSKCNTGLLLLMNYCVL